MYEHIAYSTNNYADFKRKETNVNYEKWEPVSAKEIEAYFGIILYMSIYKFPTIEMYFFDDMVSCELVKNCMTYKRFSIISKYLHVSSPTTSENCSDVLQKIRPILDVTKQFTAVFQPGCEISVDEAMIGYKGRLCFKQYMPMKPTKWGIKAWVAAESESGYVLKINIYTGKSENRDKNLLLGEQVVLDLAKDFYGLYHQFYFDNFFSSVRLVEMLSKNKTYACGTIRANRQDLPAEMKKLKALKLSQGQCL